jgi:hypothetical protein
VCLRPAIREITHTYKSLLSRSTDYVHLAYVSASRLDPYESDCVEIKILNTLHKLIKLLPELLLFSYGYRKERKSVLTSNITGRQQIHKMPVSSHEMPFS